MSNITVPYTYCLYHKPTGKRYYGVRYKKGCHPTDLWNKYFSSSSIVKNMIEEYGLNSFDYEIRKTFSDSTSARIWESKVLWRLKVARKESWINENYGKSIPTMDGRKHKKETLELMSLRQKGELNPMWGKTHTEEARKKISIGNTGKIMSIECREKIGIKARGRKIPIEKIHIPSKEEIEKRAKTNRERAHKRTMEQKKKMSDAAKGRKWRICSETGKRIFYRDSL